MSRWESRRLYNSALIVAVCISLLLRLPAVFQELPPYLFCDEGIYFSEAYRMLTSNTWVATEFRSGGFNLYPAIILGKGLSLFIPLSPDMFLVVGRVFYSVILNTASALFIAAATRGLFGRRDVALLAVLGFLLSPTILSVSRYWYPDHYLIFFSAAVLYGITRVMSRPHAWLGYLILGVSWGIGLSVKYTFVFLALPILVALVVVWRRAPRAERASLLGRLAIRAVTAGGIATGAFLAFNWSLFADPTKFWADLTFNLSNYGQDGSTADGILYYIVLMFVLSIGLIGVIGFVAGTVELVRKDWPILVVLLALPAFLAIYLGLQGLVINRNIVLVLPFLLPLFGCGIYVILRRTSAGSGWPRALVAAGLAIVAGLQVGQIVASTRHDLQPDSQVLAQNWIAENIPAGSIVGVSPSCSGPSTAWQNDNVLIEDPELDLELDYYVFNSYWESILSDAYRGQSAIGYALDQKYIHFYFFNDRNVARYLLGWFEPRVRATDLVPAGYELTIFSSNGPDILILVRTE